MDMKLLGAGLLLILVGCTSVEMVPYTVTSFSEVPLTEKSDIKIVSSDMRLEGLVDKLKKEFAKNGRFTVTDGNARYWFVIKGLKDHADGGNQNVVSVVKREDAARVQEVITSTKYNFSSAAEGVSVAVYDVESLAPVYYLEIPVYSGDYSINAVRPKNVYDKAFAENVVERVKDAFRTQKKNVNTPMPLEADDTLRELFAQGGRQRAKLLDEGKIDGEEFLCAYREFLLAYKNYGTINLSEFCEKIRSGVYKEADAKKRLGNYYLYLLVREALKGSDPAALEKSRKEHLEILRTSDAKGLAEAVPVALARLEYKLANIGE